MSQLSEYERKKAENIAKNRAILEKIDVARDVAALGIPSIAEKKEHALKTTRKRKLPSDLDRTGAPDKAARTKSAPTVATRRSQRNVGKAIDYTAERVLPDDRPARVASGLKELVNDGPLGRDDGKRLHDPKTYGAIPGITVGTWWETRQGCSVDAIHAPWVAGISPGSKGAYSIALSGGYEDDVDLGEAFTYTGSGGRDLKGTKTAPKNLRTAPQSSDQNFENPFNKALLRSSETKKPIRVIRGYKLDSVYAPLEGYRYDGLYTVEKAWREKGEKGFLVCKFAFKRLPHQTPLPKVVGAMHE